MQMTELTFLIELLLNHDLPKVTKDLVASRIKEVEAYLTADRELVPRAPMRAVTNGVIQAPSTLAAMAKHGDAVTAPPVMPPVEAVTQIAQTPATAAALGQRNAMINAAMAGSPPQKNRQFKDR